MGNPKFRLSEMIPNAWFYKLKDINNNNNNKPTNTNHHNKPHHSLSSSSSSTTPTPNLKKHHLPPPPPPPSSPPTPAGKPRKSYHFTRELNAKTPVSKQQLSNCVPLAQGMEKPVVSTNNNGFDFQLPPILTKPRTTKTSPAASSPAGGIRLRKAAIAAARRKHRQGQNGKCVRISESSMAVVKASRDPQKDFRESMVEMIVENDLTANKDLEELLASYLSLNSQEYHDVIIKVFKQIWLDLRSSLVDFS